MNSIWMPRWGDINGLFGLLLDNAAKLGLLFVLIAAPDFRDSQFTAPFVMKWMIPGTVAGVLVGGLLYAATALWLGKRTGRVDITAMPVGLDTPSVIAMSKLVLLPALAEGHTWLAGSGLEDLELHNRASVFAWHVGAAVLVMLGIFKLAAAPLASWLRAWAPRAALLGSLAAVALALIAFIPMYWHVAPAPVVGLPVLAILMLTLLAKRGVGDRVPGSVLALVFGVIVVLISAVLGSNMGWHFLPLPEVSLLEGGTVLPLATDTWDGEWWNAVLLSAAERLPVMLPFALFTVLGGVQCAESAAAAGDDYDARGVTLVQAVACVVGGALGGVVQTTPYFGHPAYKQMGAGWAYVVVATLVLALAGYFGWFAHFFEFVPGSVFFPIIIYIGLRTIAQSFEATPSRDYAAMALAAIPVLAYLIVIAMDEIFPGQTPTYNGSALLTSLRCLGNGFILTSFLWALALASILDRCPGRAVAALLLAAVCSLFGLIHSPLPNAPLALPNVVWAELAAKPNSRLEFMSPFHWCAGYVLTAGMVLIDWLFSGKPAVETPKVEEPQPRQADALT